MNTRPVGQQLFMRPLLSGKQASCFIKGRQEGRQEGRIEAAQEDIQEALSARFGPLPAGLAEDIQAVCDPAQLRQWHRLAVTVASLEMFREAIRDRPAIAR